MSLLLLFASPPIPALPANQQLKIYGKPINHRHLKSSRVSATRDDVDAFTEKSSYLFKLSSTDADSIVEYDLRKIASVYRRKPLILLRRVFQVGTTFGWWFGSRFVDELMERSDQMFPVRAAELRKILVELGPAYVKIAQAVSSRPDLIPPSYLDELSLLQDQITPFSSEVAFNTIEQELGLPIDELFSEISPEPVAAASLGQVYQARLRQSGRVVAVKVQRPGVQAAISLDIFILHFIAGLIRKARKFNTDLQAVVDEWASSLFRELDYKIEAKNGLKFRQLYGGIQDVLIPEMYVEQTTRKVLIMEWVEGQKLSEVKDLYLIEVGVYCSFNQLLEKGFYHADPHPGNLFRSYDGKLAYIDFGMMGEFKEELREGFIEACLHLVNRDFDALAKDFVTLGLLPPTAEKEAVTKALTGVFQNAVAKGVRNISFGDLLGNLGATMYKFKFRIPSYFSLVIRSLAVLEGIAISSNPNYKVLGSTYPYIARKVLTDSSPQLKSSLVALLYKEGVFRIDRLESLLTESLRARTEKALIKKQTEDTDSRLITKEILSFTLTEKGAFVREILLQEFAKGLDALGIATLDYFTSAVIPFAAPFSFSSLTEEDRINLTNLRRLLLLLSRVQSSKSASVEVKEGSIYKNQTTYSEEASLVFYQLASAQEVLPILSVIPELPPELQQEFLHLPADLAGRLISRAAARTIRRMFL
ncbi:putative aarF domain-containing protein kinase [Citrus sinensis]|uniref:AarF domain-containing protein kinase n=1 Tax=Citrus sinensis TaxID=2711 RepID=A0ACB8KTP4_CITSI|nr:putative aarF domain-containing protein kinase [Citrus sinensis]